MKCKCGSLMVCSSLEDGSSLYTCLDCRGTATLLPQWIGGSGPTASLKPDNIRKNGRGDGIAQTLSERWTAKVSTHPNTMQEDDPRNIAWRGKISAGVKRIVHHERPCCKCKVLFVPQSPSGRWCDECRPARYDLDKKRVQKARRLASPDSAA